MARYHADTTMGGTPQALSSTVKSLISVCAQTTGLCRGRAVGISVGPSGPPSTTDCNVIFTILRQTVAGTGGATLTANPIVPGDVASRSVALANFTAEGTTALCIWARALNQRSSMQWVGQDTDANLLWPATNPQGICGQAIVMTGSAYVGPGFFGIDYEDQ
jgi:hypothetical protein